MKDPELTQVEQLYEKSLQRFVSVIDTLDKYAVEVTPDELSSHRARLAELRNLLLSDQSAGALDESLAGLEREIGDYNAKISRHYQENKGELEQIMNLLREAGGALAFRDESYNSRFLNFATSLETTAQCENLQQIRLKLAEHVEQLHCCIDSMRTDSSAATRPVRTEMRAIQARLQEAERLASTDPLTNLANRREAEKRIAQRLGEGRPVCLLILDVDHFKSINDRFGHFCGDQVLQHFAVLLQRQIRPDDVACRWGGDEFLVIMDGELSDAITRSCQIAIPLRTSYPVMVNGLTTEIPVSVSMGVAQCAPGESLATAFERADSVLYRMKRRA